MGSNQNGNMNVQVEVDMTVTGEGCQPLSDLGWKKKENKFMGVSSLPEKD